MLSLDLPFSSEGRASACNAGDSGSIPVSEDTMEEMATHPTILVWRIPWTEEPGGVQFVGSQSIGHDWVINTTTSYR